jgi:hypothetical protein
MGPDGDMPKIHPHAEATYRVIPLKGGSFGVEVSIPENYPTTVSAFGTQADAEAWIAEHRQRVQSENQAGRWFTRPPGNRRR